MSNNILVVISGPSGSGKSTLVKMLLDESPDFMYSVSATTRSPRKGEEEGKDYFFVSENIFREMIRNNQLLEWAEVYEKFLYGTPKAFITESLEKSNVVLDADVQGGLQIMKSFPQALFIFIETENADVLKKRIEKRGEMSAEELEARLATAVKELSVRDQYNHVITNIELEKAFSELKQIIRDRLNRDSDR